jgi:hypothetical protein
VKIAGLEVVFSVCQTRGNATGPNRSHMVCDMGIRKDFWSRTSPSSATSKEVSSYTTTRASTVLETMWKNRGPLSKDTRVLFSSPLTSIHVKQIGNIKFCYTEWSKSQLISVKHTSLYKYKPISVTDG